MKPLIIVRPEPAASATARAARDLGIDPRPMPLFAIEPVDWQAPDPTRFDGLLLTSGNAIRHGGSTLQDLLGLPAHCVGEATAAVARQRGFTVASVGTAGVDALLESIPANERLLHLSGADRRAPANPPQSIETVIVYDAVELPAPAEFEGIENSIVAVHSPRAARRVGDLANHLKLRRGAITIIAISREAAAATGTGWQAVEAAAEPTDSALLALAARLCENHD